MKHINPEEADTSSFMTVGRTWSNIVINTVEYYIKDNISQIMVGTDALKRVKRG